MPTIPGAYKGRFESALRGYKKSENKTFGRKISAAQVNNKMHSHGPPSPRAVGGGGGAKIFDNSYLKIQYE